MARNRIQMIKVLFERLADHAAQAGDPITNSESVRWIKRKSDADARLMASASAKARIVTRQIRLVRVDSEDECFFCMFGLPEPEGISPELEVMDPTPGLFTLSILEASMRPPVSVTATAIKEILDVQFQDNGAGYDGHDLDDIMPLFPALVVYRATAPAEYQKSTDRVLGSILVRTYLDGPISLEPDTIAKLTKVFETDSRFIPFRNLVQGVLSISWENLFLECYRCIEQLYGMKRFQELRGALNFVSSPRNLAKALENHLAWRPRESEAFIALLNLCDAGMIAGVCVGMAVAGDTHERRCSKLVDILYGLRNTIVHYRPSDLAIQRTDAEWNVIICGMLDIVSDLYNNHASAFFED